MEARAGDPGRSTIQACTGGQPPQDNPQIKWHMARKVKGKGKKDLAETSSATGRLGEEKALQLSGAEELLTEKAKVLTAPFASAVPSKSSPQSYPGHSADKECVSNHC